MSMTIHLCHLFSATVYIFEFTQSYFFPIEIWDWFTQSWIQPHLYLLDRLYIASFEFTHEPKVKNKA